MKDRPVLSGVDLVPTKHCVDAGSQSRLTSELQEKLDCLVSDAVLRIVKINTYGLSCHALSPPRIVSEKLP